MFWLAREFAARLGCRRRILGINLFPGFRPRLRYIRNEQRRIFQNDRLQFGQILREGKFEEDLIY
jgi:hypothetical protein